MVLNCAQTGREGDHSILQQRSGGCSTITKEREDHPIHRREVEAAVLSLKKENELELTTSQQDWSDQRGRNHRCHDSLQQALADRRMANPMDPVLGHHTSQERQLAAVPELPNSKSHQSPKQSHAEDHTEPVSYTHLTLPTKLSV